MDRIICLEQRGIMMLENRVAVIKVDNGIVVVVSQDTGRTETFTVTKSGFFYRGTETPRIGMPLFNDPFDFVKANIGSLSIGEMSYVFKFWPEECESALVNMMDKTVLERMQTFMHAKFSIWPRYNMAVVYFRIGDTGRAAGLLNSIDLIKKMLDYVS